MCACVTGACVARATCVGASTGATEHKPSSFGTGVRAHASARSSAATGCDTGRILSSPGCSQNAANRARIRAGERVNRTGRVSILERISAGHRLFLELVCIMA